MASLKMKEIAAQIMEHLKRFEADSKINQRTSSGTTPFYQAMVWAAGSKIGMRYVSYQGNSFLSKADALAFLGWLDEGNIGTHHTFGLRSSRTPAKAGKEM